MHHRCDDHRRSSHAIAGAGLPSIERGMPTPAGTGLTRRSLMLRGLGLGMAVYGGGMLGAAERVEAAINDALGQHRVLISVFVDGGWDSLSLLAPLEDPRMQELRPQLTAAVGSGAGAFEPDPRLHWHPSAAAFRDLWNDPSVGMAVAPAIGYPSANYSHFTSRHYWEVGALDPGGATGWIGRYLDRVGKPGVPIQGVSMGGSLTPALATGSVPVASIYAVDGYDFWYPGGWGPLTDAATAALRAAGPTKDAALKQARQAAGASFQLADDLAIVSKSAASTVEYPKDESQFTRNLQDVARLLSTRINGQALPVRAIGLDAHGGYDTHGEQYPDFGDNLRITSESIKAFWADLQARGEDDRVVMLVWSEFGRRPEENGSGGCDHGAAGTAMVLGRGIRQGMIGEFPGLQEAGSTSSGLMEDGNLRATSDFRGLYSALLEQWLQTDAASIIPGAGARPGAGAFARPTLL